MRKEFIEAKTLVAAKKAAPWAAIVIRCEGGFWAFESWDDCVIWENQK